MQVRARMGMSADGYVTSSASARSRTNPVEIAYRVKGSRR
jgi:hypothetical protein